MIKKTSLAILVLLSCALAPLACGGGGSSPGADFCGKYAQAACQRQTACPDPNNPPDPSFTISDCVTLFTHACTDKLPAGETSDVSCYGAPHVNTAAQTACLSAIAMASCTDVNALPPAYDDICSMVCTTGTTTGAGGSGGSTGAAGSGAAGSTGSGGG